MITIFNVFLALSSVNLGQAVFAPLACQETSCSNQTFFSPADSDLPEGTYIAASLSGALQLAEHLDTHPEVKVTNLLVSDATVEDLATDFGYRETMFDYLCAPLNATISMERKLLQANVLFNEDISHQLTQTILDLDAVLSRIMDRVGPSLESLSYLNYISISAEHRREDVPDNRTHTVLNRDFPNLTHLTLRDPQWNFQNLAGQRTFFRSLPSLTHLHVISSFAPPLSVVRNSVSNATHIRFSGNLPDEFSDKRMFLVQWTRSLMGFIRDIRGARSPIVIVQPNFTPMLQRGMRCGNPGLQYHCWLAHLARNRGLHLSLPAREDFDEYGVTYDSSRLFPLSRALTEFQDRIMGGEGEWALPSNNDTAEYAKRSLVGCY
ncbi:hypothetical protein B0H11DRAFT_1965769 [Mycena galericulata]|nr:hypothetical protein B0H11DRAFT_1965769 [Mycena galericulata]